MRHEGWEQQLDAFLTGSKNLEFAWGVNDCATWCARWVKECTGQDFSAEWAGLYATEEALMELLAARGFADCTEIADEKLTQAPIYTAQRGDIVSYDFPCGPCLGVCEGRYSWFLIEKGLMRVKTLDCVRAWKVE